MLKNRLFFIFKLAVSLGLLAYLMYLIDWKRAIETVLHANPWFLIAAPVVSLLAIALTSQRWRLILADSQVKYPAWQSFRGAWLGLFYGSFLPGVLGGDVLRVGMCVQYTKCLAGIATAAILLDRISGVVAVFGMLFSFYLFAPGTAAILLTVDDTLLIAGLAFVGIGGLIAVLATRRLWARWFSSDAKGIWGFISSMGKSLSALKNQTLVSVVSIALLAQFIETFSTFLIARAIGIDQPFTVFWAVVPLTFLIVFLPISLGGLGVREGAMVFLLARFGVPAQEAITLSFLIYLNRTLVGALGGGLQLVETFVKKSSPPPVEANSSSK